LALLNGFVFEKESGLDVSGLKKIEPGDTSVIVPAEKFSFEKYKAFTDRLKKDTLIITDFKQYNIKGNISLEKKKLVFLTIPYDESWKLKVDGKPENLYRVNIGYTGVVLPQGNHQIELNFVPRYSKITKLITIVSIILFWTGLMYWVIRKRIKAKHKS
jgi:uncharacterized membrane protein YfhO